MKTGRHESNAGGAETGIHLLSRRTSGGLAYLLSLLPVLLGLCVALSLAVSLIVPAWKYLAAGDFSWVPAGLLYLGVFGGVAWWLARTNPQAERRAVWCLIGGSALIKIILFLMVMQLPRNMDQTIFRFFVEHLADHRLAEQSLVDLSATSDFTIWASRAMPVHYLLRRWAGEGYLPWLGLMNVLASSLLLLMTDRFARRLLPAGSRKWAVFLMMALPFQTYVATDYSHHLYSSLYLLVGTWCVWEIAHGEPGAGKRLGVSLLAGLSLVLMMLQRGVYLLAAGTLAGVLAWAAIERPGWRRWLVLLFWLGVVPLGLSVPLANRFDSWLDRHDRHQLNSILPAFVARGWCPESDGEYCGRYEQIDRATPLPEREAAMWRLVFSQIRYNPRTVCVRFPVVKTAKLFLVGYASNLEETLAMTRSRALPWARGMRLVAAPLFLLPVVWGCLLLAGAPLSVQRRWLPVCLVPLLTWGAYVFLGETSPRYSIFCQPFLALLGAWAWSEWRGSTGRGAGLPAGAWRSLGLRAGILLAGFVLVMGSLAWAVQRAPAERFYADLRSGWAVEDGDPLPEVVQPGAFRPFEVKIGLPAGREVSRITWQIPGDSGPERVVALYLLWADAGIRPAQLQIGTGSEPLFELPLRHLVQLRHVTFRIPPLAESLVFELRSSVDGPEPTGGFLQIGYLTCFEAPPPE